VLIWVAVKDPRSLFAAARAHIQLHQAVFNSSSNKAPVRSASSIKAVMPVQEDTQAVLSFLGKYGQHLHTLELAGKSSTLFTWNKNVFLQQLPHNLPELHTLIFSKVRLQLQPARGHQGVLQLVTHLTQLQLEGCKLEEREDDLEASLALLPNLQHLRITKTYVAGTGQRFHVPMKAIQSLNQLTHLELAGDKLQDADGMWYLQGLTSLQHLQLSGLQAPIRASMLSALQRLTYLEVTPDDNPRHPTGSYISTANSGGFEPGALAGKTQLQEVRLSNSYIPGGLAGVAELVSHTQHMAKLTSLKINNVGLSPCSYGDASTAACVTVEASNKLRHYSISNLSLPAGADVWHVFHAGAQLPHLRVLEVGLASGGLGSSSYCSGRAASRLSRHVSGFDTSRLVSCCPGLQSLTAPMLVYSAGELDPSIMNLVSGLSGLSELSLGSDIGAWDTVRELTRLRHLGATKLQRLQLFYITNACCLNGGAELLSDMQHISRLTSLTISGLEFLNEYAPSAKCVTLTASTDLQVIEIGGLGLLTGTSLWRRVFPRRVFPLAGGQFPYLRVLEVSSRACHPDIRHMVSCCPGLQSLTTPRLVYKTGEVAMLSKLSSLSKLSLSPDSNAWGAVCRLTRLRDLGVTVPRCGTQGDELQLLRQLTRLKELTYLGFHGRDSSCYLTAVSLQQQLLRLFVVE
jgi:hypothetical protein